MTRTALAAAALATTTLCFASAIAHAQRAVGIDVSAYQGTINWATVAKPVAQGGGGIDFAFIRATRGRPYVGYNSGVYGGAYYDDYFATNIAGAKGNGILAGAYHYARYDVNDALSEANDFLAVARNAMGPGYLRPVLDLEEPSSLSPTELSTWALTFSNRIYEVTGIRPIIYANSSYARDQVSATTTVGGVKLTDHDLWLARYTYTSATSPTQATRDYWAAQAQVIAPPTPAGFSNPYGIWNSTSNKWDFWQYTDGGRTAGISGNVDQDVANGDIEFVKDFVVPAIWTDVNGGNFGGQAKWNNFTGSTTSLYFPDANSRAIINVASANPTITFSGFDRIARSLQCDEAINFNAGTLTTVQYANFTAATTFGGGGLIAGTNVANTGAMTVNSGSLNVAGAFTGAGTLTVNGGTVTAASIAHALAVAGGTVTVSGAVAPVGTLAVTGGTLNVGSISGATLNVTGAGRVNLTNGALATKITALTGTGAASGGTLNLKLSEVAIDYAAGGSPATSIRQSIRTGFIESDQAIANTTGVGYAEATKVFTGFTSGTRTWNGVSVDTTSLLLALALFGDTDLNGTVNYADLASLAAVFGSSGLWQNGDSTYDGLVNQADLDLLAANYGKTLQPNGGVTGGNAAQFAIDVQNFAQLVPEPTTALAALAPMAIAIRRRRRV